MFMVLGGLTTTSISAVWSSDNSIDKKNTNMNIINKSVFLAMALAPQILQAQGTLYFSSLNQTSTGSEIVGSDSWLAAGIYTGNNADGYMLNSVQLGMMNDSGNPSGFTVMIYAQANNPAVSFPGNSLGMLSGSSNPSTSGTYLYTDDSNIILSQPHFILLCSLPEQRLLMVLMNGVTVHIPLVQVVTGTMTMLFCILIMVIIVFRIGVQLSL